MKKYLCQECGKEYRDCKCQVYISKDARNASNPQPAVLIPKPKQNALQAIARRSVRLLVIALIVILASCSTETSDPGSDSWVCEYCQNTEIHQTATGCWFNFPSKDGVHYVTKNLSGSPAVLTANDRITGQAPKVESAQTISAKGGDATCRNRELNPSSQSNVALIVQSARATAITATFTISGAGKFTAAGGGTPKVVLYFQSCSDMSGIGDSKYCRWWSNQNVVLKNGTVTLAVPLLPKNWHSVYGETGDKVPTKFNGAWAARSKAGMTFGGLYDGHGVWGSGKFTLTDWRIQ
jgi:hypothetical protein